MYSDNDVAEIVQKIANSKKYRTIYSKTIEHTVKRCLEKYDKKQVEKKARSILHQIWSAYYKSIPDFVNVFNAFSQKINNKGNIKEELIKILSMQTSSRERLMIIDSFYRKIFVITGYPNSIIDHACGLNPFSIILAGLQDNINYQAYDIEKRLIEFISSCISCLNLQDKMKVSQGDVIADEYGYADVVLMLKLLPVIEQQEKGSSLEILRKQRCKYLVVSFPIKSLSGVEKGMLGFYSNWFKNLIKGEKWRYDEILFDNELVFIIKKM